MPQTDERQLEESAMEQEGENEELLAEVCGANEQIEAVQCHNG